MRLRRGRSGAFFLSFPALFPFRRSFFHLKFAEDGAAVDLEKLGHLAHRAVGFNGLVEKVPLHIGHDVFQGPAFAGHGHGDVAFFAAGYFFRQISGADKGAVARDDKIVDEVLKFAHIAGLYQTEGMSFMSFGWFDTRAISKEMKIMARNLAELLQIVRADTREAEVTLLGAEGRAGHMLVIFSLPVLEAQTSGAAGQAACPLRGETSGAASGQTSQPGGKDANH